MHKVGPTCDGLTDTASDYFFFFLSVEFSKTNIVAQSLNTESGSLNPKTDIFYLIV